MIAVSNYDHPYLQKAIHEFKYNKIQGLKNVLGNCLAEAVAEQDLNKTELIPVPIHKKRRLERGFNQSELLTAVVAEKISNSFSFTKVVKTKNTASQMSLKKEKRISNLSGSFKVIGKSPRKVILIDDVCSTGNTLKEVAKVLKAGGTNEIVALVLAWNKG